MELTKTEEQLMERLWAMKKAFMKDLIESYPAPKPAPTTLATLLKRMNDKGFISYRLYGNLREYYPIVRKSDYFSKHMKGLIKDFFNNSTPQFASFFTRETDMSASELEELKEIIEKEIQKKKE